MKKIIFITFISFLTALNVSCMRNKKLPVLNCSADIEFIKEKIKSKTDADSVLIYTKRIKEELYFPEIVAPVIVIENATTKTLDFKILAIDESYEFGDKYWDIETGLKTEGYVFAKQLIECCDMTKFNDLIVEFIKKNDKGEPMYRFICHYDEFMNKKIKELTCFGNIELLKEEIKLTTSADTVLIYTQKFDIYLQEVVAPVIVIENATTKTLDFKSLPIEKYQGFGSHFDEINENLKIEGSNFAKKLIENCNMKDFNELIIDYIKSDSLGYPMYRFRCFYDDLLQN